MCIRDSFNADKKRGYDDTVTVIYTGSGRRNGREHSAGFFYGDADVYVDISVKRCSILRGRDGVFSIRLVQDYIRQCSLRFSSDLFAIYCLVFISQ